MPVPIVKWVGGKRKQADDLLRQFPKTIHNYHEPFVGGGSVLFAVLQTIQVKGIVYAYDTNESLIHMYINIQQQPARVYTETHKLAKRLFAITASTPNNVVNRNPTNELEAVTCQESFYYWIRSLFNQMSDNDKKSVLGTAYFIFINKTCFRGLFRVSDNGFNVSFGNYKNPEIINEANVLAVSALIKNVVFQCMDFRESLSNRNCVVSGDFVYLDPPYAPINPTSFVKYTINGFSKEDHLALFHHIKTFNERRVLFIMSNSEAPLVVNAFENFPMRTVSCKRAIHSSKPNSIANELVISNLYSL